MKKQVNSKIGSYKTSSYKDVPKMVYIKTGVIYDMMISTIFFLSLMILPQLNLYLDDEDIMDDLRIINKVSGKPVSKKVTPHPSPIEPIIAEAKIDDGRLYYDKRW